MKHSFTAIILGCFISASGFAGIFEFFHLKGSNQSTICVPPQRAAAQHVTAPENEETAKQEPAYQEATKQDTPKRGMATLDHVHALIAAAAEKHGVPIALVHSIIATESNFRTDAVSSRGSIGLMQLLPSTARLYGADPRVPAQNIDAGTRYLRSLIEKYRKSRSPLKNAIAAYNAGCGAVDRYHGVPPFRETRGYVSRVLALMKEYDET